MDTSERLNKYCQFHINNKAGDAFVGVVYEKDKVHIYFPLCFRFKNPNDDKALREDIFLLLKILSVHGNKHDSKDMEGLFGIENTDVLAPYIYVIKDYLNRGYYVERDSVYTNYSQGKINWNRTIKTCKPYLQDDGAYYLNFVTKKDVVNDNELITKVHQYCVYRAFELVGWLFTSHMPTKPSFLQNKSIGNFKDLFEAVINRKLANTFQDSKKILFAQMLSIITNESNGKTVNAGTRIGVKSFEHCWESMVNRVFGNLEDSVVKKLQPSCQWHFDDSDRFSSDNMSSKLIPDTIMSSNQRDRRINDVYVLDSKYYRYGHSIDNYSSMYLPKSSDINKQVTYGEYVYGIIKEEVKPRGSINSIKKKFSNASKVYNSFIIPGSIGNTTLFKAKRKNTYYRNFGYADASWKTLGLEYEKVQGILIDMRFLMEISASQNETEIANLADVIREGYERRAGILK